jgi:hypothetical protein
MATTTILGNTVYFSLAGVNLSDQVTNITINQQFEELETTSMGSTSRVFVKGLETGQINVDFLNSYVATEVNTTLQNAFGTAVAFIINPNGSTTSATNPKYTGSVLINNLTPINGAVGDLQTQSLSLTCVTPITYSET